MNRCLIFDADDTLWENNIYFERAIGEFLELMKPFAPDSAKGFISSRNSPMARKK